MSPERIAAGTSTERGLRVNHSTDRTVLDWGLAAIAGLGVSTGIAAEPLTPVVPHECELAERLRLGVESSLFSMMPADEQARIAAGLARAEAQRLGEEFGVAPFESAISDLSLPSTRCGRSRRTKSWLLPSSKCTVEL